MQIELRFFTLHSVHQCASFELSKSTIGQIFQFLGGGDKVGKEYREASQGVQSSLRRQRRGQSQ